jgi:hypothetical protein
MRLDCGLYARDLEQQHFPALILSSNTFPRCR